MEDSQDKKINPNLDDLETLQLLPGVGPTLAQLIQDSRPYTTAEDLQKVSGIGLVAIDRWRDMLIFAPPDVKIYEEKAAEMPGVAAAVALPEAGEARLAPDETIPAPVEEMVSAEVTPPTPEVNQLKGEAIDLSAEEKPEIEQPEPIPEPDVAPSTEEKTEPVRETELPVTPKEEPEVPEAAPAVQLPAGWISRSQAVWGMVFTGFAALILSVALCLGILAGMNGGLLQFAAPSQVAALTTQAKGLEARVNALEQDTQGLRARLDNLEGLGSRISGVENTASDLQDQVKSVLTQVNTINEDIGGLQSQIDAVSKLGDQFSKFLASLQSTLNDLLPLPGGTK